MKKKSDSEIPGVTAEELAAAKKLMREIKNLPPDEKDKIMQEKLPKPILDRMCIGRPGQPTVRELWEDPHFLENLDRLD